MAYVKKRSVLPIYFIGGTWLVWAWLLRAPLYRPSHYIMAALASLIAYYVGKMLFPDRGYEVQDAPPSAQQARPQPKQEQKPKSTGNPEIDALLAERDRAVGEMRRLNDAIEDPRISAQISLLETTTGKIIDTVAASPGKLPQIRKFMNYYLPTTLKLLNAYDRMDSAGVSGANIDGTKGRIEDMLDTICTAFTRLLDDLYGEEAMDISAEITVMEQMLAQEGLGGMTLGGS
ncbi:MAG: 5-bromo-4-chloroindolyl phosphate hydrolysis family protein [Oscillospiraceae bacterium]|nr:5-bromo-4-chloroindolyl phosphate hydrolysis family protein [Oscillospiraceae bacterium]